MEKISNSIGKNKKDKTIYNIVCAINVITFASCLLALSGKELYMTLGISVVILISCSTIIDAIKENKE